MHFHSYHFLIFLCSKFTLQRSCIHLRKDIEEYLKIYLKEDVILLNKSEIARRFNCDPRTVDRYIKIQKGEISKQSNKRIYNSILDEFKPVIINKVDVHGSTAMAVYKFIKKKGYSGKYSNVARFVKEHKDIETKKATIRFETTPGLQAQVDWKEEMSIQTRTGETLKVNVFLMILGYSRLKYICLTSDRTQETLFRCLMNAFYFFGGVPHEILFDNMKTVVDHSKSTFTKVELNQTFKYFARDAGFKTITCRPYRPQTKGKVEALAKLMDRLVVYNDEIDSYDEFDGIIREFQDEINEEISQATGSKPNELFLKEKEHLLPMPDLYCLYEYLCPEKTYKVHKDSMIVHEGKRYSIPTKYIGSKVTARETDDGNLCIYYNNDCIACHPLSNKKYNYTLSHAAEILSTDACKEITYDEVEKFIKNNLSGMDVFLGG